MTTKDVLYEIMNVANDTEDTDARQLICQMFESGSGQDVPESGYMVDELIFSGMELSDFDKSAYSSLIRKHYAERG